MNRTEAQEARAAIEKLYIVMRHLFNRGHYKPFGVSGQELIDALLTLAPEIYGSITDTNKVELDGLVYVIDRLPKGIERCRFVRLISEEGYASSGFNKIIPAKRRRNCYQIDKDQMLIEVTRGRSEIYDIMTHLTFLFVESRKIRRNALSDKGKLVREWLKLEEIVKGKVKINDSNREMAFAYLSTILGRTFEETRYAYERFCENREQNNGLFEVVYWLGTLAHREFDEQKNREVSFSASLRERIGHHIFGEVWASNIKKYLTKKGLIHRPIHIISANLHSVLNSIYVYPVLHQHLGNKSIAEMAVFLQKEENNKLRKNVMDYAYQHGLHEIKDTTGTNIHVQILDSDKFDFDKISPELSYDKERIKLEKPVLLVMDYAFGEQAYETMDELLKPYEEHEPMPIASISIMGKAGILTGEKGDIMIPTAHVFEGTADNYPIANDLNIDDFKNVEVKVCEGPMITVLGTSLQNKDVLSYFKDSSWGAIGLEMEGAHYQKAIQSATKIRKSVLNEVKLRYAYYASDNPLISGSTLASGSLGLVGIEPTYQITILMLNKIFGNSPTKQ